jgi:hypothetical protein
MSVYAARVRVVKRFWRPLVGLVVAYAIAAQGLLIAVGGFCLPATASDVAPAFELCLHDPSDAPGSPVDNSKHSQSTQCLFCFAGTHHAVLAAIPIVFQRIYFEITETHRTADNHSLCGLPAHSIADPRAPPPAA